MESKYPRRSFIKVSLQGIGTFAVLGIAACGREEDRNEQSNLSLVGRDITLYDTHAMATYFDGGLGPKTGIIKVSQIVAATAVPFVFWHGHGGVDHRFTVLPEHFAELKKLKRVTITTTVVEGHAHKLFIDPVDPKYRVAGAQPVVVQVED